MERAIRIMLVVVFVGSLFMMLVCGVVAMGGVAFVAFDILAGILRHTHGNTIALGLLVTESYATIKMFVLPIGGLVLEGCLFLIIAACSGRIISTSSTCANLISRPSVNRGAH